MSVCPQLDPASKLQFVINAAAGSVDAETKREAIETALRDVGRSGDLLFSSPADLPRMAREAATKAVATHTAVVAVGGDGTINTVAQATHALGCAMGVVPQGTFNFFARAHGIPADAAAATRLLFRAQPMPVQVGGINDRVFLVNASVGLYPELLEDREAYKARFGRSRWVALWAASVTLLRSQRRLRLHIEEGQTQRDVQTLTLFVGNNRLQLERLGVQAAGAQTTVLDEPAALSTESASETAPEASPQQASEPAVHVFAAAQMTAVMLRPIGALSMIRLMLHGAMGTLGEAQSVEQFNFTRMQVRPKLAPGRRGIKVAFDGEVARMHAPLDFRVLDNPLYLLKMPSPKPLAATPDTASANSATQRGAVDNGAVPE